jgi:NTP pyrophosphatase (non-canonical NTP hydrolase)
MTEGVQVTISGPQGSGKSLVHSLLERVLVRCDAQVRLDPSEVAYSGTAADLAPALKGKSFALKVVQDQPLSTAVPVSPPTLTLDAYQARTQDTAIYPGQGTPLGLIYVALKMNGEAGEFSEHLGKAIRDDKLAEVYSRETETYAGFEQIDTAQFSSLTLDRRAKLMSEVSDVLWYVAAAARELGFTLSEIAEYNLAKLADRKARGVLGGSGDNR